MWGKTISYIAAFCEDAGGQEDVSESPSASQIFSVANIQSIQTDSLFFLQVRFAPSPSKMTAECVASDFHV